MAEIKLLDCTLRDGGYINNWNFKDEDIKSILSLLSSANIDFIECGYLNKDININNKSIFNAIEKIKDFLPIDRKNSKILAMIDVTQFSVNDITDFSGKSIDGIRVVFYKHQIQEALEIAKKSVDSGYLTFLQPMVTIDYTLYEYEELIRKIAEIKPAGISIVDSFGYMTKDDNKRYFQIIDSIANKECIIGFHSHNNTGMSFACAQDLFEYKTDRILMVDSSLEGIGRCAGNLYTEAIAQYFNSVKGMKYDIVKILECIDLYIEPIKKTQKWGYNPYYFVTALYHCHPNFATYLLEINPDVNITDFIQFVKTIPVEMKTKCKKPYVEELYKKFYLTIKD
ncbi:hypothetical protein F5R70_08035 [Campylobacter lari]|uniref:Pyruvate carboxyltransferase domain-containing protein n=2 Tax=Campylobacter lari TaxID=201 RepID=A0A698FUU1_CAMLA|nr:aldolase catalytic domain-containing protein [Campylobacter lari]ECW8955364.1 hypothetical protein [Campylobacter lari]MBT0794889.1 aldolase catalytic domain-containing protein [Campylobacter lari]